MEIEFFSTYFKYTLFSLHLLDLLIVILTAFLVIPWFTFVNVLFILSIKFYSIRQTLCEDTTCCICGAKSILHNINAIYVL